MFDKDVMQVVLIKENSFQAGQFSKGVKAYSDLVMLAF